MFPPLFIRKSRYSLENLWETHNRERCKRLFIRVDIKQLVNLKHYVRITFGDATSPLNDQTETDSFKITEEEIIFVIKLQKLRKAEELNT